MPEGIEVRPEGLHRGADQLRDDAGRLGAAVDQAGQGARAAAGASGDGPLGGEADALAGRLDALLRAVAGSVTECAATLDAASAQYLATDQAGAAGLGPGEAPPIVLPGLEPPR
ncbi:hypothetical protein [Actinomycetospora cinnamomea]|uniref:Excreted virulence factor EspC (Type VII ESX diderm) n=1 Tax=Actinomycetospora cinnamomea TaxID=663609 RepID=A0A2U1F184_9PSEU|nr:hypothetical protein [Actinomycetospora cinnamomea]PVZ05770.1 hypothetical protein C8D89_11424 [Actinomycetospora cinnamomea]